MNKKTATLLNADVHGFKGTAQLWRLNPPLNGYEFVVSSATVAMFSGPETYLFAADEKGKVSNWSELDGSYRGGLDHERAVRSAGYEIT